MKLAKSLIAALCAIGFAGMANGQTVLHVVGSTAYRASFIHAIIDSFGGSYTAAEWGNSNPYKCNGIAISGTYPPAPAVGGNWYVVDAYFTGSAAGVTDLVAQDQLGAFLNWNTVGNSTNLTGTLAAASPNTIVAMDNNQPYSVASTYFDTTDPTPDAAFSDSYEGSVAKLFSDANFAGNVGAYSSGAALASAITSAGLKDAGGTGSAAATAKTVGIIPFEWLVNNPGSGNTSPITNITQQIVKELVKNGVAPQSQFTGNSNDAGTNVFLVGRNEDSGTRIDTLSEGQAGFDVSPIQAQISFGNSTKASGAYPINNTQPWYYVGGNGAYVTAITQFPATYGAGSTPSALNTEPNISWSAAGHSGQITGGDVGNVLLATSTNYGAITIDSSYGVTGTAAAMVGYISLIDAQSELSGNSNGNCVPLAYDGVSYSVANVQNGTYTVWDYEHFYYLPALTGLKKTIADQIATQIFTMDAPTNLSGVNSSGNDASGILYGSVNPTALRSKTGEGGIVTP